MTATPVTAEGGTNADAAATAGTEEEGSAHAQGVAASNASKALWLLAGVAVLVLLCLMSLAIGSREIPLHVVIDAIFRPEVGNNDHSVVRSLRMPRTFLGLIVGIALGISGAVIQAMTRNPLADTGVLGINAGAAFSVAVAIGFLGVTSIWGYVWFAFIGAVVVTIGVYILGSMGRGGATPVRLTLGGVAIGAVLGGITTGLTLLDPGTFDSMRYWQAGTVANRDISIALAVVPFIAIGLVIALAIARPLNAVALGDDLARSLGANIVATRVWGVVAVTLLAGAATAAAGPISFVGLMIPHVARWIVGPDQRWIFLYTIVGAPMLLLSSDIIGRIIIRPAEMPVGIVTAFVGAPVLIWLVRRGKASGL